MVDVELELPCLSGQVRLVDVEVELACLSG